MSDKFSKLANLYARLYIHLAKEIEKQFGLKGREAIRQGIKNFAYERGQEVREKTLKQGQPLTIKNFYNNFDSPLADAGFKMTMKLREWDGEAEVNYCPFAEIWKEMGEEDLGKIYCEVDEAMLKGYNPSLELQRPENILDGHKKCVFYWRKKKGGSSH